MNWLWPSMNWCRLLMMTRMRHAQRRVRSLDLTEAGPPVASTRVGLRAARKEPPIYLRFPPGLEGTGKRTLLGLDDDESRVD